MYQKIDDYRSVSDDFIHISVLSSYWESLTWSFLFYSETSLALLIHWHSFIIAATGVTIVNYERQTTL